MYPWGQRDKAVNMYIILDDQSNHSLARSNFFELFNVHNHQSSYSLRTCAGTVHMSGRTAECFQIEWRDGKVSLALILLIECDEILIIQIIILKYQRDVCLGNAHKPYVSTFKT